MQTSWGEPELRRFIDKLCYNRKTDFTTYTTGPYAGLFKGEFYFYARVAREFLWPRPL